MLFAIIHGFLHKNESVKYTNKKLSELNYCTIKQVKHDINCLIKEHYIKVQGNTSSRKIYKGDNYLSIKTIKNHTADNYQLGVKSAPSQNALGVILTPSCELSTGQLGVKMTPSTRGHFDPKPAPPLYIKKITKKEITNNQPPTPLKTQTEQKQHTPLKNPGWLVGLTLFKNLKRHFEQTPPESMTQKTLEEFLKQAEYHISKRVAEKGINEQQAFNQFLKMIKNNTFGTPHGYIVEQKAKVEYKEFKPEPTISVEQMQANRKKLSDILKGVLNG